MAKMHERSEALRERGGIPMHDYTQAGRPTPFSRSAEAGVLSNLGQKNFDKIARNLGTFSLGLGLLEALMPRRVQKLVGVRGDYTRLIRMAGLREAMHALLIFMQSRPNQGVWSRVVGDAMDLACLGAAFRSQRNDQGRLAAATTAVLGITALDVLTAAQISRKRADEKRYSMLTQKDIIGRTSGGAFHVTRSLTINRSPEELYQFWRNFENLPQFMFHLESVRVIDERRSHWVAKAPAGAQVEWDAEIIEDRPNELIAWQGTSNADVPNSGQVRFEPAPADRGTVVRVEIEYRPPGGAIGRTIARLFGEEPGQQVAGDLRRFKQVMETGEVVRSEGSPEGYGQKMQRPAQPLPGRDLERMSRSALEQQPEQATARE